MSNIPDYMMTGAKLKRLTKLQSSYPVDIQGQQNHTSEMIIAHQEFERHLQSAYSVEQLEQMKESIAMALGEHLI